MTGSEKTGILNSDKQLLENAYYIITPTAATTEENQNDFKQFVLSLGSIALILDYREHDHATAAISHLPHMIAYSLVNLIEHIDSEKRDHENYRCRWLPRCDTYRRKLPCHVGKHM